MKTLPILVAIILVPLSTLSMAKSEEAKQAAKQATVEACLMAAEKRYGTAKAISKTKIFRGGGNSGYKIDLQVGERNKKITCIKRRKGKIMMVRK